MKNKQQVVASICFIMRVTLAQIAIVFITISSLYANEVIGQEVLDRKFSLDVKERPLNKLISEIQNQTNVSFSYSANSINAHQVLNLGVKEQRIGDFLKVTLADLKIGYQLVGDKIVLYRLLGNFNPMTEALPIQGEIHGRVTDENGSPIQGATITQKGTQNMVSSDVNGGFKIQIDDQAATVIISCIGYENVEVQIRNNNNLLVTLKRKVTELENVVVTALGLRRKERALGYATQSVNGSTLQTVKGLDMATSLTGKIAGVIVKNSAEFAQAPELTMRGESPLIVIDGVPYGNMSLRDIPQDDIDKIDFLKGPTASALYGERGGAGAIMVTTLKGDSGKGFTISVNSSNMFESGYLAIPEMQNAYGRVVNTSTNTYVRSADGSWGLPLEGQEVIQWDPISKSLVKMPYIARGANNFANFLVPGHILNNNISISQRGMNSGFRASSTWVNNKGTYPNSRIDKVTYSVAGDVQFNKFSLNTSLAYNRHQSPNIGFGGYTGYDPMYSLLIWGSPDWNILDYQDYWLVPNEQQNSSYTGGNNNPYFDRYERLHPYNKDIFNGQLTLNYDLLKNLKLAVRTGYDTYSDKQTVRISQGSFQGGGSSKVMNKGGAEIWGESMKGSFNSGLSRGFSTNTEAILTGDYHVAEFHFDSFLGGSLFYQEDEGMEARTQGGLSVPGFYSLKSSVNPATVSSVIWKKQTNSVFGKLGIGWRNLAFVEATFRNDWTSSLPESTRSYFYPSVSGSLVVSDLLPKLNWLSLWKLRGNWTMSKGTPNVYDINNVYSIGTNQWNGLPTATLPTAIRPSDIYTFASNSSEFGTQMIFWNRRVSLDVNYFKKRIYDPLRMAAISEASGYTNVFTNTEDETERRGWEISLNLSPVQKENWKWDLGFNWSKFANYYLKIDPKYAVQGRPWIAEGNRTDHFVFNELQTDNKGNLVMKNGVPTYKPILSLAGYGDPDWTWGINTSVSYKNLRFGIAFDGRVGGLAQSITEMYMWRSGNHPNSVTDSRYKDATNPGTRNHLAEGMKVVSGAIVYDTNGAVVSDDRVFEANDIYSTYKSYVEALHKGTAWGGNPSPADLYSTSFLKLREASISYEIPTTWIAKMPFKRGALSAVGQNLFYWAKQFKYSDIDGGSENFTDPSLRYVGFNVKLDF